MSTRNARSTPCPTCGCCPRASFRSTKRAARAFAAATARCSRAIRSKSPLYKDVSNGVAPGGIEYYLPLFFEATATLADYLPPDAVVALRRRCRRRDRAFLAGHRIALQAAARRPGAAAASAHRSVSAARCVQWRAQDIRANRIADTRSACRCRRHGTRRREARARRYPRCRSTVAPTTRLPH